MADIGFPSAIGSWVKRQTDVVTGLGVMLGGAAAVIVFFGGSIPPWYTPAQAQTEQRAAAVIQQQTVQALGKINDKLDGLAQHVYQGDCQKYHNALDQATQALAKNPNDPIAKLLRETAMTQIAATPGCGT